MAFPETIVICDIKVGRCSQLNEYMNINGQGHSLTLNQGHSDSNIMIIIMSLFNEGFTQLVLKSNLPQGPLYNLTEYILFTTCYNLPMVNLTSKQDC